MGDDPFYIAMDEICRLRDQRDRLAKANAELRKALLLVRQSGGTDLLPWQTIDVLLADTDV